MESRIYERRAPEGERAISLLRSVVADSAKWVLHAVLEVPVEDGIPSEFGSFRIEAVNLDDQDAVIALLEELAPKLNRTSMYHAPAGRSITALFVGELSSDEQEALICSMWARGVHLKTILREPRRRPRPTEQGIARFDGELALIAVNRCGGAHGRVRQLVAARTSEPTIVELVEPSGEDLLVECALQIDDLFPDEAEEEDVDEDSGAPIRTWLDVEATVKHAHQEQDKDDAEPCFCLCDDAWKQLKRNDFAFPAWMEESLLKLFRLARKYAADPAAVGDFPAWARREEGLWVVMKDAGLAVHKQHLIKCRFDGKDYRAEVHVKLQSNAKWVPPKENGRIYFALDSKNRRFIVHHIGLKLE